MNIDLEPDLLARYGGNAPRYTSYPTALQFHERLSAADYAKAAGAQSEGPRNPVSVYVHVPFCFTPCYYCACNRVITRRDDTAMKYVARLVREVEMRAHLFQDGRTAQQLHFGGGTPTYLSTAVLSELVQTIGRFFPLTRTAGRDYSIEIDPRTLNATTLSELKQIGFNRLSLGVQDFDPGVQSIINRMQPEEMVGEALQEARRLSFSSVNFDLIYGLPGQSLVTFANTLERVAAMRPDRIALYGYAHMPTLFKAQRRFESQQLPDAKERIAMLSMGIRAFSDAGYVHIGMDHFALPSDSLTKAMQDGTLHRSFQGYTTHAEMDLVNFGASAIGRVGNLFVQNTKHLHDYRLAVDSGRLPLSRGLCLTRDDQVRSDVIQQIMCRRRISIDAVESKWGIEFAEYFSSEIESLGPLQRDGLVTLSEREVVVTPRGEYLLRNVAVVFDAYAQAKELQYRASKAI